MRLYKYPKGRWCWLYRADAFEKKTSGLWSEKYPPSAKIETQRDIFFVEEDIFKETELFMAFKLPENDRGYETIVLVKTHIEIIEK